MDDGLTPWQPLLTASFFETLTRRVKDGGGGTCVSGLTEGARALIVTLLARETKRKLLVIVPDDAALDHWRRDLAAAAALTGGDPGRTAILPALDADPYGGLAPHPEVVRDRVQVLQKLAHDEVDLLVTPARGLLNPLPSPAEWDDRLRTIRKDDTLAPDEFVLDAIKLGYRRVDIVSAPGEISRRGGIVDVFPPTADEPVRIELFGDTVDSIRAFDTDNQRSTGQLDRVVVTPGSENPPTDDAVRRVADFLQDASRQAVSDGDSIRPFRELLERLQEQGDWPGFEALTRLTCEGAGNLFSYTRDFVTIVDEADRTDEDLVRADHDLRMTHEQSEDRILPPPAELYCDARAIREELAAAGMFLQELAGDPPEQAESELHVPCRQARSYAGRVSEMTADMRRGFDEGQSIVCVMRAEGSVKRLREILDEYDLAVSRMTVEVALLRHGFELPQAGLIVLAERDLFGEVKRRAEPKGRGRKAFLSDFRDLKVGDHVVHVDHGVAKYIGLGRPKGGSLNRDFMMLEFSRGDRLFVPADRLDLVQKYSGVAGQGPKTDRLGGPSWERVKKKVRKSVESMARELLELYAKRGATRGHIFGQDTPWQQELEAGFPFEMTLDQQRAIEDIKGDMQSDRAADRLLVGDVGFGKTEVAVRAAFKAVMEGRQVAVLAPTTVLAVQHFETFKSRYASFPVRVEMVSRFRSAGEIKQALADLKIGAVDVLIGTHRLLSKDVEFKQLGLLVVDEEQRFGVRHKERLKQMSTGIDVLSMTATPIPRTLQMSLAGVRDLSVIETPPPGRTAIQTYIIPFRKQVLAQAIRQEIRRGGQVYFVHNKIETLPALIRGINEMVPEARVAMGHGQMGEHKLEKVMLDFIHGDIDVFCTTTIIENGLDIPRANTIIVNRADRFGLAQLYQLRGRVGRSHQHAYAYFVVPSRQHLRSEARQRLKALQEFSDLGAGFRLAAADLEIRGAGELLGSRQHGHIASLGFDMYCQMLERAVQEMRGDAPPERKPVSLHLGIDIKITGKFLPDPADRLVVYKRLAQASTCADVDRLQAEIEDRYGHLPATATSLFDMGRLRLIAEAASVQSVDLVEDKLIVRFHDGAAVDPQRVLELVERGQGSLSPSGRLTVPAPSKKGDRIETVVTLLERLTGEPAA
jgi:transcription-repair coupling factor (superfamily II helicase)